MPFCALCTCAIAALRSIVLYFVVEVLLLAVCLAGGARTTFSVSGEPKYLACYGDLTYTIGVPFPIGLSTKVRLTCGILIFLI